MLETHQDLFDVGFFEPLFIACCRIASEVDVLCNQIACFLCFYFLLSEQQSQLFGDLADLLSIFLEDLVRPCLVHLNMTIKKSIYGW